MVNRPSIWKKGYFDVPVSYTEEQVMWIAPKYMQRFGEIIEASLDGFSIVSMLKPVISGDVEQQVFCQPDTKRYTIFAQVTREPRRIEIEVPDRDEPEMAKIGFTIKEE